MGQTVETKGHKGLAESGAALMQGGQAMALGLLLAEMQALAGMMPGLHARPLGMDDAAARAAEDAAAEAAFDNMPV